MYMLIQINDGHRHIHWNSCYYIADFMLKRIAVFNKCWPIRRAIVILIILLHALATISFSVEWLIICSAFIENGGNLLTVYHMLIDSTSKAVTLRGITASISTILVDSYMIWCCWMVWGQHWAAVLLPILSLIVGTVSKILSVYFTNIKSPSAEIFLLLYPFSTLATTLCGQGYLDVIASITKVVAPTLLIGRAAAGHTQPNDEGGGSTVSSLHFQAPLEVGTMSFQESTTESAVLETDMEAQWQQLDELVVTVEAV
ncbi:hypothetical protein IW261DRAFT_1593146 [Armillaria novae-zelandiae]|uniref:Uncharacterized protein n=1 Tax=Armillaria novae-zelandiae TaxID=153914 RepID=A0AA39PAS8_9AGAR|nr:hypothetical protein IW261DRAFT_1593146 [Armillaria novae-zelandiae]